MSLLKNIFATAACAGLLLAQPAAAATRSADSLPSANAKVGHMKRVGSVKSDAENLVGVPIGAVIAGLIAAGVLTYLITKSNDSPG